MRLPAKSPTEWTSERLRRGTTCWSHKKGTLPKGKSDVVSRRATYKNYTIRSTTLQRQSSTQWMFSIAIYWEHDRKMTMRSFSAENTYSTEAEADLHGIAYG